MMKWQQKQPNYYERKNMAVSRNDAYAPYSNSSTDPFELDTMKVQLDELRRFAKEQQLANQTSKQQGVQILSGYFPQQWANSPKLQSPSITTAARSKLKSVLGQMSGEGVKSTREREVSFSTVLRGINGLLYKIAEMKGQI